MTHDPYSLVHHILQILMYGFVDKPEILDYENRHGHMRAPYNALQTFTCFEKLINGLLFLGLDDVDFGSLHFVCHPDKA